MIQKKIPKKRDEEEKKPFFWVDVKHLMQWRCLLKRPKEKKVLKETQIRKTNIESENKERKKKIGFDGDWGRIGCRKEQRKILWRSYH